MESRDKYSENEADGKIIISVVIPVYNGEKHLHQAIESALLQRKSIKNIEILIVDDASTDRTQEIAQEYVNSIPDVRYFRNKVNRGAAESRNYGVRNAAGEWIAFLDADDWWEPDKLKKQLKKLEETNAILCTTARKLVSESGESLKCVIPVKERITYKMMAYQNWINCSTVLLPRRIMLEFPMMHDEVHEDYITWMKIMKKYGDACAVNEPLLKYRLTGKGKSGNKWKSAFMTWKTYRYLGFSRLKAVNCFLHYVLCGVRKYRKCREDGRS